MSVPISDLLSGLNPPQQDAVRHTNGPLLVLAGAGSGKTRVITRRIAYIVGRGLAAPENVLAVTFTNKAAGEMRERVAELVGPVKAKGLAISTFHSFCLQVLRRHIEQLGYRKNFTIASESDARVLLRRVCDEINGKDTSYSPATFHAAISLHKNSNGEGEVKPGPVKNETQEKYQTRLGDVFERYQSALRAANSVDFDDLLLLTTRLWREHPRILAACRAQHQYVMVDEYQDTNKIQFQLMKMLVDEHRNFCVVGDDDQSIYGWRGADTRLILDFAKHFPGAKTVTLDQNYRSTQTILDAANHVIANNTARHEKKLWSELGRGRAIDHIVVADEEEEAKHAVSWLQHIREKAKAKYSDFALLYRSNLQSKNLEIAFRKAGIPYAVYGGQDFFERAEVKDIVSYLKILANPRDEAAFLRVVNMPRRGIGDQTLHHVHDICRTEHISLGKALAELLKRGQATRQAEEGIRDFLRLVTEFRERLKRDQGNLRAIAEDLVLAIDYRGELERVTAKKEQAHARWQNVELVLDALGSYQKEKPASTLSDFLDDSHLNSDGQRWSVNERRNAGVSLMTIHSAKGLEFPFVFIMGLEDGLIPHEKSMLETGLDEERRLFYVALTRGKRHVTLFECCSRNRNGKDRPCRTSRFLSEIPEQLVTPHIKAVRQMVEEKLAVTKPLPRKPSRARKP